MFWRLKTKIFFKIFADARRPGQQAAEPTGNAGVDLLKGVDSAGEVDGVQGGEGGGVPDGGAWVDRQVWSCCLTWWPIIVKMENLARYSRYSWLTWIVVKIILKVTTYTVLKVIWCAFKESQSNDF